MWMFPILVVLSLYLSWFAARGVLGRWPRPMFDDPKNIHGGWMWLYDATWGLILWGTPAFLIGAVGMAAFVLVKRNSNWKLRLLDLGVSMFLFAGLIGFLEWDPHNVWYWFFD